MIEDRLLFFGDGTPTKKSSMLAMERLFGWINYSKLPHYQRPQKAPQQEDTFKVVEKQ